MCEAVLPKENEINKTGRGGMALVHFRFNYDHWQFRQETGADCGRDCTIEYISDNEWHHDSIEGQVKGTKSPESYLLKDGNQFSYKLEKKTINYALRSSKAFLLLLCDLNSNTVYYLPIQEYFINNPDKYTKLENPATDSMKLRIPVEKTVCGDNDAELIALAKTTYVFRNNRVQRV